MQFKRLGEYLIDLEMMNLVNVQKGKVYKFDFDNMTVTNMSTPNNTTAPIRYDESSDSVLVWRNSAWKPIPDGADAVVFMFHYRIEKQILN